MKQLILITCVSSLLFGSFLCSWTFAAPIKHVAPKLELINTADVGFGATFFAVLRALDKYDRGEISGIHLNFNRGCYLDTERGPNWWEYYFEPIDLGNQAAEILNYRRINFFNLLKVGYRLSSSRDRELIQKYVQLKPDMQEELDAFVADNFSGHYVIGVHHRGTDKKTEAKLVPLNTTLKKVENIIANLSSDQLSRLCIFVATDEQKFIDMMISRFPDFVVYGDFVRSSDNNPLHYSRDKYDSNYQKGKEAIFDCLLLSQCDVLVFPRHSSLSLLSSKLNADQVLVPLR